VEKKTVVVMVTCMVDHTSMYTILVCSRFMIMHANHFARVCLKWSDMGTIVYTLCT